MPKRSEIELHPDDILLPDVPDDTIERLRLKAALNDVPVSRYVLGLIADHFETPREAFASATMIVLDPE